MPIPWRGPYDQPLANATEMPVTTLLRIGSQAALMFASGWLLKDADSIPLWQIGLGLVLAVAGLAWMYFRER